LQLPFAVSVPFPLHPRNPRPTLSSDAVDVAVDVAVVVPWRRSTGATKYT